MPRASVIVTNLQLSGHRGEHARLDPRPGHRCRDHRGRLGFDGSDAGDCGRSRGQRRGGPPEHVHLRRCTELGGLRGHHTGSCGPVESLPPSSVGLGQHLCEPRRVGGRCRGRCPHRRRAHAAGGSVRRRPRVPRVPQALGHVEPCGCVVGRALAETSVRRGPRGDRGQGVDVEGPGRGRPARGGSAAPRPRASSQVGRDALLLPAVGQGALCRLRGPSRIPRSAPRKRSRTGCGEPRAIPLSARAGGSGEPG